MAGWWTEERYEALRAQLVAEGFNPDRCVSAISGSPYDRFELYLDAAVGAEGPHVVVSPAEETEGLTAPGDVLIGAYLHYEEPAVFGPRGASFQAAARTAAVEFDALRQVSR